MDVIDTFLATFIAYIDSGFGLLAGDVAYLTATLIVIDITLAGLFWALSENSDVIAGLIKKVLYVGFFAFIIGNFSLLAGIVFDSFAQLGLTAGGSVMTAEDLLRPGFVAGIGFEAATPLLEEIGEMTGPISFFTHFVMIAVMFVAWAVIIVAFFVLAIQLFITILEFKLTTLAGFILVPFALWNKTTFLAERVLGNVITSGIKLMVIAVIIGIGSTLFASVTDAFTTGDDVTLAQVMGTVLAAMVFFWMGIFAPGIASGLITGAPQLGAGSAAGAALGVAAGTIAAGMAGRAALGGAASAASGAVKAGASMTGGARTAYAMGSLRAGGEGPASVAAGIGGVASAAGGAVGQAVKQAVSRPVSAIREAYARGVQSGWRATGGASTGDAPAGADSTAPLAASPQAASPAWARRMQTQQRVGQAGQMAVHSLRDGDRGSAGAAPKLNDKDD
ncbi:MAG: P-type conjugative transfer protein TrbL [Hyphomonas sp. 34-62-18]|nr:P-type conjugative transfer protein TrbL [Hyphomonas sp. 34-62-18]OZB19112.1 MAG: P-type conjugative transfer protein TrbL [Hyphomonas sp. 34-62-18]